MAVEPEPRALIVGTATIGEAVRRLWLMVTSGEAPSTTAALDKAWPELSVALAPVEYDRLAYEGLRARASNAAHYARDDARKRPALNWGFPHDRKKQRIYFAALGVYYEGAGGESKPLAEFTLPDLDHFEAVAGQRMRAEKRKITWAKTARRLLTEHRVEIVRDLPRAAQEELAALAADLTGGSR
jgi:hypothetical protein